MLERIVRLWLEWTGRKHLVPFLEGLANAGRPSSVAFPSELLGQGLALAMSGLNNTMAFQAHTGWVWPLWYERQSDPGSGAFVPTGMNLITHNITMRNWTSLGLPDSDTECMLDPVGMLTLQPFGPSAFPFVRIEGTNWLPPRMQGRVTQNLEHGILPCVETRYTSHPQLDWSSECCVVGIDSEELVLFRHRISNNGRGPLPLVFGIALRPYNPLSVGHVNRIRYKEGLWRINHKPVLWLHDEPDRTATANRREADPLLDPTSAHGKHRCTSRSGIASGVSEWDVVLAPGEVRYVVTVGTLRRNERGRFHRHTFTDLLTARTQTEARWHAHGAQGMHISIPDRKLERAWQAVRNRLFVFDDGDHFSPGTYLYHQMWIRDSAFLALVHENLGLGHAVDAKIPPLLALQDKEGFFRSQDGEWDSQGQALFTIANHIRHGGELELARRHWPALMRAVGWLERTLESTRSTGQLHRGLLPAGFSAEHFGPNDHYYWDDFWALAGLRDMHWLASAIGSPEETRRIARVQQRLHSDLEDSIAESVKRTGGVLPSSPYRDADSACIGNLVAISPLNLFAVDTPWVAETVEHLWRTSTIDGMFFQRIIHTGLNPYLSAQLAHVFLAMGDPRFHTMLESILRHASGTMTWPEAIHPRTGGGCMGDGDHGWAAAEFLMLVRNMLVYAQESSLYLAAGVPPAWWSPRMDVSVDGASTRLGTVSWSLHGNGDNTAEFRWSIERNRAQPKGQAFLRLPHSIGLSHPMLSSFPEAHRHLPLLQDQGIVEIPLPVTPPVTGAIAHA